MKKPLSMSHDEIRKPTIGFQPGDENHNSRIK